LAAGGALLTLAVFMTILIAEHFAQSGLSALRHQISEYANHGGGWLMRVGFVAWATSLLACAIVQFQRRAASLATRFSAWSLVLAAAALILTAIFNTETIAGELPMGAQLTNSGRLHDLGSGAATVAIAGAALADACARSTASCLRRLSWTLIGCAAVSDVAMLVVGPSVGGLRERVLVALACSWEAAFAFAHHRRAS
jgi:hypothetical protein